MSPFKYILPIYILLFHDIISAQENIPPKRVKGRYTRDVEKFTVVVPKKVDSKGGFISHHLPHFYQLSRDEGGHSRRKREAEEEKVHYSVMLDGVDHHLELEPSLDFLAPGLVIEEHYNRGNVGNESNVKFRHIRSTQCHFSGAIKGVPDSQAALSTCYGLAGYIRTPKEHYIIEPAERYEGDSDESEGQLHILIKRSEMLDKNEGTNCGTKGRWRDAWEERVQWEKVNGRNVERWVKGSSSPLVSPRLQKRTLPYDNQKSTIQEQTPLPPPDLYIEVMLTIDYKVTEAHKSSDIEAFILTIMNMVTRNFEDSTIGTPLNLKLVRIVLMRFDYPELDTLRFTPQKLLQNFCIWQMEFNPHNEDHPNHHDFALLVSKFEPCQGHVTGVTHMASVCRPDKACAVVSEEGLLLANIITHQLGHSLGAEHDDGENGGCIAEEPDGTKYHMGPMISSSSTEWSICSKQCISQFLVSHAMWCMMDIPFEHDFHFPTLLPGQIYSATEQCSLNFHMSTKACRTGDFCKTLYCQISSNQCATTGDPPAEGTPCTFGMWCFHGKCVQRGQRPGAVNGEWAEWSEWTQCSRSCGGGVQSSHRSCTNPAPTAGGRYCLGKWVRHRMCSINVCEGYGISFADVQCKMTDGRTYRGRHYTWSAFNTFFENIMCTLVCTNDKGVVAIRSPAVIDGTPCKAFTRDVCIEGNCKNVGCDWVIDSKAKEDMCGICHGNGTECRIVHGVFDEPNIRGMTHFLKLPTGSSRIYVKEMHPSNCYLAVSSVFDSVYYLNDPRDDNQLPGVFNFAGSSAIYEKRSNMDRFIIHAPIKMPIAVSLKCKDGVNKGIRFQYAIPERDPLYIPSYRWQYLDWDHCSSPCGGGIQMAKLYCVEERGGEVQDSYCEEYMKPKIVTRTCNNFPCTAKWWIGPWSDCDCTDGQGVMVRIVMCMKSKDYGSLRAMVVDERECAGQPKPKLEKPCNYSKEVELLEAKLNIREYRNAYDHLIPYNEEDELSDTNDNDGSYISHFSGSVGDSISLDDEDYNSHIDSDDDFVEEDDSSSKTLEKHEQNHRSAKRDTQIGKGKSSFFKKETPPVLMDNKIKTKHFASALTFKKNQHVRRDDKGQGDSDILGKGFSSVSLSSPEDSSKNTRSFYKFKDLKGPQISGKDRGMHVVSAPRYMTPLKPGSLKHFPASESVPKLLTKAERKQNLPTGFEVGKADVRHLGQQTKMVPAGKVGLLKKEQPGMEAGKIRAEPGRPISRGKVGALMVEPSPVNSRVKPANQKPTTVSSPVKGSASTTQSAPCPKEKTTTVACAKAIYDGPSTPWNAQNYIEHLYTLVNGSSCIPPTSPTVEEFNPADTPAKLETFNMTLIRLKIAPLQPNKNPIPQTDAEFEAFGPNGRMPIANELNFLPVIGPDVLKTLDEARKHATKPPFINTEELM